mmetsp:Transcript_24128/g.45573  ORF Transcript_24128/g.45573 Transcript_24128/m.45573 type:complete len:224 (+) Transcript_24128:130-801(+)
MAAAITPVSRNNLLLPSVKYSTGRTKNAFVMSTCTTMDRIDIRNTKPEMTTIGKSGPNAPATACSGASQEGRFAASRLSSCSSVSAGRVLLLMPGPDDENVKPPGPPVENTNVPGPVLTKFLPPNSECIPPGIPPAKKASKMSSGENPAAPEEPPPFNASAPNWSYLCLFSLSLSTEKASPTRLNASSAPSSLHLSGCNRSANFRYAFLISSSLAFFSTPRMR